MPRLKIAIITSIIINIRGRRDSQLLTNLINKLLNLKLKIEIYAKGNSIFNINYLFNSTILTSRYALVLKQVFKQAFSQQLNLDYTTRSPKQDIQQLAHLIKDSLDRPPYSSSNLYIMLNIITKGVACLVGGAIIYFNAWAVIYLDRLAPLVSNTTIAKDAISSSIELLCKVSYRVFSLIISYYSIFTYQVY